MINLTSTFVTCMLTLKNVSVTQPPILYVNRFLQGAAAALNTESAKGP